MQSVDQTQAEDAVSESRRQEFKKYYNTKLSADLLRLLLGGNLSFQMYFTRKEQLLDIYKWADQEHRKHEHQPDHEHPEQPGQAPGKHAQAGADEAETRPQAGLAREDQAAAAGQDQWDSPGQCQKQQTRTKFMKRNPLNEVEKVRTRISSEIRTICAALKINVSNNSAIDMLKDIEKLVGVTRSSRRTATWRAPTRSWSRASSARKTTRKSAKS